MEKYNDFYKTVFTNNYSQKNKRSKIFENRDQGREIS